MNRFRSDRLRHSRAPGALAFLLLALLSAPAGAQRTTPPRIVLSGWGGWFTDLGGFSDGNLDAFYRFDDAPLFGIGIHYAGLPGISLGVDALYSSPTFERFDRQNPGAGVVASGDAKAGSILAAARLAAGGGGRIGLYFSGGAGIFAWDLDDPELEDGWDLDFAMLLSGGLEYLLLRRLIVFGEYGQWWVYHQKDDTIQSNTANLNLLRFGARIRF